MKHAELFATFMQIILLSVIKLHGEKENFLCLIEEKDLVFLIIVIIISFEGMLAFANGKLFYDERIRAEREQNICIYI